MMLADTLLLATAGKPTLIGTCIYALGLAHVASDETGFGVRT